MTSHVETQVQQRIAEAARRREARRQQREELAENRRYGLVARHRAKMRRNRQEDEDA